ncbi:MAG: hypothetical protein LQ350_004730 [Teloschistes chrysophthalmus]|nr:MAG: hypothetical protein LQ350_004730 [Niorma chrysophthalma]
MSEDQELLARIGQLAGHINLHKAQPSSSQTHPLSQTSHGASETYFARGVGSPRPRLAFHRTYQGRGRAYPRNHSLVLNNHNAQSSAAHSSSSPATIKGLDPLQPAAAYVTKRGRHKQLINASVLDRVTLQRKQAIDDSQQRKLLATDQWERQRMYQYVETLEALPTSSGSTHKIEIDGLKFQILKGGSKLARIPGQHLFWPKKLLMLIYYRYIRRNATNTEEDNRSWCPLCTEQARQPLPVWDCQGQRVPVLQVDPVISHTTPRPNVYRRVCISYAEIVRILPAATHTSADDDDRPGMDGEDVDSDDLDDEFIEGVNDSGRQALAEQKDFVGF